MECRGTEDAKSRRQFSVPLTGDAGSPCLAGRAGISPRPAGGAFDDRAALRVLQGLVAWSLVAFGGAYPWTTWPIVAGAAWLAVRVRPSLLSRTTRALDAALLAALAAVALQLVPLPLAVRTAVSPQHDDVQAALSVGATAPEWHPLSLNPEATLQALVVAASVLIVFWAARDLFASGGVRRIVRTIAALGLIVALAAVVQKALSPRLIYGVWQPFDTGAQPYGPFVNRNHLVMWLAMAIAAAAGSALMRSAGRHAGSGARERSEARESGRDPSGLWLVGSIVVMTSVIVVSLSRSGVIGLLAMAVAGSIAARGRLSRGQRWGVAATAVAALVAMASYTDVPALLARFDTTIDATRGVDRRIIWRDTASVIRDFPAAGIGVGAYQRAMLVYQTTARQEVFFNHAHNQYLQVAAEGGLLLVVPVVAAIATFIASARRRLRDSTARYFMRGAAGVGLIGAAVLATWDTGLTMPANGMLVAILAAIAVHERRHER